MRELYQRLKEESWIDPWLDEEKLLPGQDWDLEIEKAVEAADAVIVFLSNNSVSKEGYIQRELRFVLRIADFKPEGTVFVIPLRLEDCPTPRRLSMWQYVDYFPEDRKNWSYKRLLGSLKVPANKLGVLTVNPVEEKTRKEKEDLKKAETEKRARCTAKQKVKKASEDDERREIEENAGKEKEEYKRKTIMEQIPIPNQDVKRYGIGGIIIATLIGLIFSCTYIFRNLPTPEEPIPTESIVVPTNANLVGSTPKSPKDTPTPSSTKATEEPTPPPTLDVGSTRVSEKDGMVMVYVPAGEFEMGSQNGRDDEKPVHTVYLDAFWIDRTEITNAMFAKFIDDINYVTDTELVGQSFVGLNGLYEQIDGADWQHPFGPGSDITTIIEHPVVHVSWKDAYAYCKWASRRLPTEAEWEKAASWDEENNIKQEYPWGYHIYGKYMNYCDRKCSFDWADKNVDDGYVDTAPVGNYLAGASPYGALDMAGNAWEWVADWYSESYYANSPSTNPLGPDGGKYHVLRGGAWIATIEKLRTTYRFEFFPTSGNDVGFRCAMDASE